MKSTIVSILLRFLVLLMPSFFSGKRMLSPALGFSLSFRFPTKGSYALNRAKVVPYNKDIRYRSLLRLDALEPSLNNAVSKFENEREILLEKTSDINFKKLLSLEEQESILSKIRQINVFMEGLEALEEIEKDLSMFRQQAKSEDPKTREAAKAFMKEFLSCKEELELSINNAAKRLEDEIYRSNDGDKNDNFELDPELGSLFIADK